MKEILITIISCIAFTGCELSEAKKSDDNKLLSTKKVEIDYPTADVAILGTFHFRSNVDAYKRKFHIDISSEKTQQEIQELLDLLKNFRPTKIVLEAPIKKQEKIDSLYQEYRNVSTWF